MAKRDSRRLASLALAVILVATVPLLASADSCELEIAAHETALRMPPGLLHAVAMAESGRWDRATGISRAWPWTVTAGPDRFQLASRNEAVSVVQRLQHEGRRNLDVGCMQINLDHHPTAFVSLEQAFEPASNVTYAARYLLQLWRETGSWLAAVAVYHSRDPERGRSYLQRVLQHWHENRERLVAIGHRRQFRPPPGQQDGRALLLLHLHAQAMRSTYGTMR